MRARAIVETRQAFDARGRRAWRTHPHPCPPWCGPDDLLHAIYRPGALEELFRTGLVVWGHLVQANNALFEPGPRPHPAMFLYGLEPAVDDALPDLERCAGELFALKGTTPADPEEAAFARVITDELARGLGQPVPTSRSRGHALFTTTILVHREALPRGLLAGRALPLLLHPTRAGSGLVLPRDYWCDRLLFEWGALQAPHTEVV